MRSVTKTGSRLRWFAAALAAVILAGCADVPASGLLQHTTLPAGGGGGQQGTHCCGLIMSPPAPGWSASQIVQGFLLASADFADRHAIAREYLTGAASRSWQPGPGPAVTVIAEQPTIVSARQPFGSQNTAVVEISAQELGQVSGSGQYIPADRGRSQLDQGFTLERVNRQWRIAALPSSGANQTSSELLLTKDLFQLAYQPRDLYYLDPTGKGLVPDPVFVPNDSAEPAADLVRALLVSPAGWLGARSCPRSRPRPSRSARCRSCRAARPRSSIWVCPSPRPARRRWPGWRRSWSGR